MNGEVIWKASDFSFTKEQLHAQMPEQTNEVLSMDHRAFRFAIRWWCIKGQQW